jgi:IclR family transcriptional regulator, KDG regulon repressor
MFRRFGYLTQNPATARYAIGPKSRLLARLAPDADLMETAEGSMRELRDALGHTVVLSAMTPAGALVMSTIASKSPIEIGVRPGSELSFHASAQGKVLLAFAPRPVQERVLAKPLPALTAKTVVDRESLDDELSQIMKRGYAAASEQALLGINAIAAPIFNQTDACVASVAIVGSIQFLPEVPDPDTVGALKRCGAEISRKLGYGRGETGALMPAYRPLRRKAG